MMSADGQAAIQIKARLLATLHVLVLPISIVFILTSNLSGSDAALPRYFVIVNSSILLMVLAAAYGLNRRGAYQPAAILTVLISIYGPFSIVVGAYNPLDSLGMLDYLVFSILASGVLLSSNATLLTVAVNIIAMLVLALGSSEISLGAIIDGPLRFVAIIGSLAMVVLHYERLLQYHKREQMHISEARFRAVSELTSDYAYSISVGPDDEIQTDWMTEAFERITGYPAQPSPWRDIVHPDDRPRLADYLQRLIGGEASTLTFRIINKDGNVRWLEDAGRPVWDAERQHVERIYGAGQDITQRRQTYNKLALRDRALASIRSGVTIADATQPDMPLIYVNQAFIDITGYAPEDLLGRNCRILQGDDRDQAGIKEIRRAIAQQRSCQVLLRNYRKDGSLFWNEFRMSSVFDEAGHITHYVGVQMDVTQRMQAEETLRTSEAQKSALLNALPDLMLRFDAEGNYLDYKIDDSGDLLVSPEALIGRNVRDILDESRAKETLYYIRQALQHGLQIYEYAVQMPQGLQMFEARMVPSGPQQVLCIVRNITQRKTAEKLLREQLEDMEYFQIIDHEIGYTLETERILNLTADLAMRRSLARGCIIAWRNDTTQQLEPLTTIGQNTLLPTPVSFENLPHEALQSLHDNVETQWLQTPATREAHSALWFGLYHNHYFYGVLILEQVPDKSLNDSRRYFLRHLATRTTAALVNVQNYRRNQQHAQAVDLLYALSKDLAASLEYDVIASVSARSLVSLLDSTSAFFSTYSTPSRTHAEIRLAQFPDSPPTNEDTFHWPLLEKARTKEWFTLKYSSPTLTEEEREVLNKLQVLSVLVFPLRRDETLSGVIVVCDSRYERHFQDSEIGLARNLLTQVVVALQRAQVVTDLQEAEQVKSEMIRLASHDLRNPTAQIIGYLELLMDELPAESHYQEYIAAIERGARKIERLLEDILNLERAESQQPDTWQSLNIQPLLSGAVHTLGAQATLKRIKLVADIPPELPHIIGNDVQLEQAATNLINNAIKYTPGGGQVSVVVTAEDERLFLRVYDTGYGIPEEYQAQLFQRFYRVNVPGTENISGTGLGLSLVKAIVQRHGGEVFFESEFQVGSMFGFWLPLAPLHDDTLNPVD